MTLDSATLTILNYPHPALRQKAQPVPVVTDQVRQVAQRMLQLMHEAPGVGLAAPQVGLNWRLFVTNHTQEAQDDLVFINPKLSEPSNETAEYEEGCLSLPNIYVDIRRPRGITVTAQDLNGGTFTRADDAFVSRVWQHEKDHLDGTLIIDRMSPIDRLAKRRAIKDLEAAARSV